MKRNENPPLEPSPKRRVPRSIPREAVERPFEGGAADGFDYFLDEKKIAHVYYHSTGAIEWEMHFDAEGRLHGVSRYGFEDGRTKWQAHYAHGLQHGLQQQWDEKGKLLYQTRFVRGTGVDLWFDMGRLAEEREFVDGQRHGVERWWSGKNEVYSECYYKKGLEHGIKREWNDEGRLRRGYPQYFVEGCKVSRRDYEKARRNDPMLVPIDPRDNRPRRKPPVFETSATGTTTSRRPRRPTRPPTGECEH